MAPIKSIAIIGAGPAGAITVDALSQEQAFDSVRVFERREKAGGCWCVLLLLLLLLLKACPDKTWHWLGSMTQKTMSNNYQILTKLLHVIRMRLFPFRPLYRPRVPIALSTVSLKLPSTQLW
jgi:hypothetical protein